MSKIYIALIVVIILCVLYIVYLHRYKLKKKKCKKKCKKRRDKYKDLVQKSSGNYDTAADAAIKEIDEIKDVQPEDAFTRGTIIEQNRNLGAPRGRDLRRVVGDFQTTVNLIQQHDRAARETRLAAGLQQPLAMLGFVDEHDDELRGNNAMFNELFMLQHIDNFANNMFENNFEFLQPIDTTLLGDLQRNANVTERNRKNNIKSTLLADKNNSKKDVADKFITAIIQTTNDPQNVHDPSVNKDNNATMQELLRSMDKPLSPELKTKAMREIREFVTNNVYETARASSIR